MSSHDVFFSVRLPCPFAESHKIGVNGQRIKNTEIDRVTELPSRVQVP